MEKKSKKAKGFLKRLRKSKKEKRFLKKQKISKISTRNFHEKTEKKNISRRLIGRGRRWIHDFESVYEQLRIVK